MTTDDFSGRRMRKCYSDNSGNRCSHDEQPPASAAAKPTKNRRRPLQKRSLLSCPNRLHHLFSPKDINAIILSSENARLRCSIIIAVLVVMSCVSVPHGMTKSNSVIASRPLYIIILTDVTIVVARLLILGKPEDPDTAAGGHNEDDEYNWSQAFAMLEIGLVLYQTIRALFMDCSFYLVVVLCGLSLL
nr:hypothetical protein CQW23_11447 [Ipomoea batatas]GMC74888.1 hypothetical protein CQW23_11447 [Ipomoea batatas]GMC76103.1 hypothetical protein CQW23_11447 [Ipomoea batatas]GME10104.1 hypothetical protein CQW23_11447 [Ipomoea batatas]